MAIKPFQKARAAIIGLAGYLLCGPLPLCALNPGDVALTRITQDSVILLALVDIPADERIIFTDIRWTARGFDIANADADDGFYVWSASSSNGIGSKDEGLAAGEQVEIVFPKKTVFLQWQEYLFLFQGTSGIPVFLYSVFADVDWNLWDNPARGLTNDITSISIGTIPDAPLASDGVTSRINHEIKSEIRETFKGDLDQLGLLRKLAEIDSWTWVENNPDPINDGDFPVIPSTGLIEFASPIHLVREDAGSFSVILRRLYGSKDNVSVRLSTVTRISDFARFRPRTTGVFDDLTGVAYGNGLFAVVGSGEGTLTSSNGFLWNLHAVHDVPFENLHSVAFGSGLFVAVGKDGLILTSANGAAWTHQTSPTDENLYGVEFLNDVFFAVGEKNTILRSDDAINWISTTTSSESGALYSIAFGEALYVAVGKNGSLFSSEDGTSWLPTGENVTNKTMWEIVHTTAGFVAVGDEGRLIFSSDGTTWVRKRTGERLSLYAVAVAGDYKVAVGKEGLIITTDDSTSSQALGTLDDDDDTDFQSIRQESRASSLFDVIFAANTVVVVGEYGKIISRAITGGTRLSAADGDFTPIVNAGVFWANGDTAPKVQTIAFDRDNVTTVRKRFDLRLISNLGEPDLGTSTTQIAIFNSDPPFDKIVHNYGPFLTFRGVELSLNNEDSTLPHQLRFRIQNTSSVDSKALLVTFDGSNLPDLDLPLIPADSVSDIILTDLSEVVQSISLFEFLSNDNEPVFKHKTFINSVFIVDERAGNGVKEGTLGIGFVTDLEPITGGSVGTNSTSKDKGDGIIIKPQFSGGTPPPPPGEGGGEGFGLVLTEIELTGSASIETGGSADFTAVGTFLDPFTLEEFVEELTDPQPDWGINLQNFPVNVDGLITANPNPTLIFPQAAALSASSIDGAPVDEQGNPIPVVGNVNVSIDEPEGNLDYSAWVIAHELTGEASGEKDDFDGDGLANLLEYSLGTNPTVANPEGLTFNMVYQGGGSYTIQYTRPKDRKGVVYKLQKSTAFHPWSDLGQTLFAEDEFTETWESSATENAPANFRLVIERFDQ